MEYTIKDGNIYSTELDKWVPVLDYLQNIINTICFQLDNTKFEMTFIGSSVVASEQQKSPYIRVWNKYEGEDIIGILKDMGIPSELDLYESDDGDDDNGRPIMLQRWSVRIPELNIPESECDLPRTILCPSNTDSEDDSGAEITPIPDKLGWLKKYHNDVDESENDPDDGSWIGR